MGHEATTRSASPELRVDVEIDWRARPPGLDRGLAKRLRPPPPRQGSGKDVIKTVELTRALVEASQSSPQVALDEALGANFVGMRRRDGAAARSAPALRQATAEDGLGDFSF